MIFPQYLWRIRSRMGSLMIRRGNDCNEPIEKAMRKDMTYLNAAVLHGYEVLPVGVAAWCDIGDAELYSTNHPWDWFNE